MAANYTVTAQVQIGQIWQMSDAFRMRTGLIIDVSNFTIKMLLIEDDQSSDPFWAATRDNQCGHILIYPHNYFARYFSKLI
jgi:hypothetical protein